MPANYRFLENERKGKSAYSYADLKANILVEVDHMSMVCELQFLLDFMIESKKKSHAIYEIMRSAPFVRNVAKICSLYSSPKEEVLAIAMRQDLKALGRFMVNHPKFDYFVESGALNESSLIHFISQGGNVKMFKFLLCARPPSMPLEKVINLRGWDQNTPLMFAVDGKIEMVKVSKLLSFSHEKNATHKLKNVACSFWWTTPNAIC